MFGMNMRVVLDGFGVDLRPLTKADLPSLVMHFNSMKVHMYTLGIGSQTIESEEEWYNRTRNDNSSFAWGIVPEGSATVVGLTTLHNIDVFRSATSGIIIWDTSWWRKGIATRAHLARTLFAADYLQLMTIKSGARLENNGSVNALKRMGYNKIGVQPRTAFRAGRFLDTQLFTWLNPDRIDELYPKGLPKKYKKGVLRAKIALDWARQVVKFP